MGTPLPYCEYIFTFIFILSYLYYYISQLIIHSVTLVVHLVAGPELPVLSPLALDVHHPFLSQLIPLPPMFPTPLMSPLLSSPLILSPVLGAGTRRYLYLLKDLSL